MIYTEKSFAMCLSIDTLNMVKLKCIIEVHDMDLWYVFYGSKNILCLLSFTEKHKKMQLENNL